MRVGGAGEEAVSRTQSSVEGTLTGRATFHPGRQPARAALHGRSQRDKHLGLILLFLSLSCHELHWPNATGGPSDAVHVGEQGEEAGRLDMGGRPEVTGTKEMLALREGRSVR